MSRHEFHLLDCTFRDGGYHTGWQFSDRLLSAYLETAGVVAPFGAEIGYLGLSCHERGLSGNFRDLPFSLSQKQKDILAGNEQTRLGVMIDAKTVADMAVGASVNEIRRAIEAFPVPVAFLRIAATAGELERACQVADTLRERSPDLDVFVNLMRIGMVDPADLERLITGSLDKTDLSGFYLADSFGHMEPAQVTRIVTQIRNLTDIPVGFHAHDNLGLGALNAAAALDAGAQYLDGTFSGLGRGAGNVATETLALLNRALSGNWHERCDRFLAHHIHELRGQYVWGTSPSYRVQALLGVHPSYVQRLTDMAELSEADRIERICQISAHAKSASFDEMVLSEVVG